MSDKVELLPCPFCNGPASLNDWYGASYAGCDSCHIETVTQQDKAAVVAAWNRRSVLAQQPAPAVPEGWKLVPVRATREQVNAVCMHPDLARTLYHNMVEAAPAAAAPVAQEPVECCPYCGGAPGRCDTGFPHPPAAEQPYSTTSDRYRAELYDEVWEKARALGFGNVTEALADLERPDTVKVPRELLESTVRILQAAGAWDTAKQLCALLGKEGE